MKYKLFPNVKRMTNGFCVGILCVTISVLALRFTVFSDMAVAPQRAASSMLAGEEGDYQINGSISFSTADSKGDLFITNLSKNRLIKVEIRLKRTDEIILSTGFINPGSKIDSGKMNPTGRKLADGEYACVAEITAYDPQDVKTVTGTSSKEVQIYIGEKTE